MNTPAYLGVLQHSLLAYDMIKVLAHGLSKREAVLWAVKSTELVKEWLENQDLQALDAAAIWVENPSTQTGKAAMQAAQETTPASPAYWSAQAATWTSGAPAADVQVAMDPDHNLAPDAAAGAVLLAAKIKTDQSMDTLISETPIVEVPDNPMIFTQDQALEAPKIDIVSTDLAIPEFSQKENEEIWQICESFIDLGIQIAESRIVN